VSRNLRKAVHTPFHSHRSLGRHRLLIGCQIHLQGRRLERSKGKKADRICNDRNLAELGLSHPYRNSGEVLSITFLQISTKSTFPLAIYALKIACVSGTHFTLCRQDNTTSVSL